MAGDLVTDEIEVAKERKGGDARGNGAGDLLPVGEDEGGEAVEAAEGGGEGAGHEAGAAGAGEDGVGGLASEGYVGDAAGGGVAADAVVAGAAVGALPRREDADVGLGEGRAELHQGRVVAGVAGGGGGGGGEGEGEEEEERSHCHYCFGV